MDLIKLTIEEFKLKICEEDESVWSSRSVRSRAIFRKKVWLYLIENDILTCPMTGEKVAYCLYEYKNVRTKKGHKKRYYYKFYSDTGTEFSIDHKLPISKGGPKKDLLNLQAMTLQANRLKSDELIYL